MIWPLKPASAGLQENQHAFSKGIIQAFFLALIIGLPIFLGLLIPLLEVGSVSGLLLVPGLLVAITGAFWVLYSGVRGHSWAISLYFLVVAFTIEATFRRRDLAETGLDAQSLLKLLVWGGALLIGLANFSSIQRVLRASIGLRWVLFFAVWVLLSTVYSITPAYTFGGGFAYIALIFFIAVLIETNDVRRITMFLVYACGLLTLSAVILYVAVPSMAMTPAEGGKFLRLTGFTGSPNNLGRVASLALLFTFFGIRSKQFTLWRADIILIILSSVVCLGLSWSRTAIIALTLSIGVIVMRKRVVLSVWGAAAVLVTLLVLIMTDFNWDTLIQLVSRRGSLRELTSFTGRTDIWNFVWGEFLKQPLIGYGYGSTKLLVSSGYRTYWGWTTASAHNMLLQTLVTTGVVGAILVVTTLLHQVKDFFKRPNDFADGILIYVLYSGLFEAGAVGMAPSMLTIIWFISLAIPRATLDNVTMQEQS